MEKLKCSLNTQSVLIQNLIGFNFDDVVYKNKNRQLALFLILFKCKYRRWPTK